MGVCVMMQWQEGWKGWEETVVYFLMAQFNHV